MANKTTNYKLTKPLESEFYDVDVLNENMDLIDREMKDQEDFAKEHAESKKNPHGVTAAQVGADAAGAAAAVQQNLNSHAGNSGIHVTSDEKKTWDGKADLDSSGKVPTSQLPEISSVKTYTATIGTTWTEDETTGVKSQNVAISGVLAKHTAKVDHAYTGSGTSEDYATFVEAENQYLDYITNGYAETYDGGIKFCIFGDAPTVSIPIVVEVA